MTKLDLQTPDFVAANAARLAEIFPNCVTESRNSQTGEIKRSIDFDLLRQELAYDLVEGPQERYRLDWPGKREALALANAPIRKTLRPCKDESVDFDTTRNLYIEGDNLDALKLLQETYLGKVTMFYIDPPYNTGNDFIYDDNFSISREEYEGLAGTRDEEGNAMFDEEKWKQNSTSNGRFHSEWLSMMYPRLKLARNLLNEKGSVWISCDDHEIDNLIKIGQEVFGGANFVGSFIWEKRTTRENRRVFSVNHDFVVCFAKDHAAFEASRNLLPRPDTHDQRFTNPDKDPRGVWQSVSLNAQAGPGRRKEQFFTITTPSGRKIDPPPGRCWIVVRQRFDELVADGRIWFGEDGNNVPRVKTFLSESPDGITPHTLWNSSEVGTTDSAKRALTALFGNVVAFDTPKSVDLIARMLHISTGKNDIIVDFFSGSATTAHAVMQLNAEDGGKRRHIMVQLPEPCDEKSEAFKAGYKTIAEIGKERIRRAGKKILAEWQAKQASSAGNLKLETEHSAAPAPDIGFRVLKIDSSNMADVYYQPDELTQDGLMLQVDNLKPSRQPEDLLFQVLLDWGVDLALPITEEMILKRRVLFVAENALAACFDTGLDEAFVKELAKRQPLRAVFRDSGYTSDATKINFEQIFKALSPHTELKTL